MAPDLSGAGPRAPNLFGSIAEDRLLGRESPILEFYIFPSLVSEGEQYLS